VADFKTLQFPNTSRGQAEKIRALRGESAAGWRIVSETVTPGAFKGGEACCLFLVFPPCALLAGHKKGQITVTLQREAGGGGNRIDAEGTAELPDRDPLLRQAAEIVIEQQQGTTSLLQRRLKVGYGRAAKLIEELEDAGILERGFRAEPRTVLVTSVDLDRLLGKG
jgi:DNA segregation ATPase FtsK/SpoIIIE-like protein